MTTTEPRLPESAFAIPKTPITRGDRRWWNNARKPKKPSKFNPYAGAKKGKAA